MVLEGLNVLIVDNFKWILLFSIVFAFVLTFADKVYNWVARMIGYKGD